MRHSNYVKCSGSTFWGSHFLSSEADLLLPSNFFNWWNLGFEMVQVKLSDMKRVLVLDIVMVNCNLCSLTSLQRASPLPCRVSESWRGEIERTETSVLLIHIPFWGRKERGGECRKNKDGRGTVEKLVSAQCRGMKWPPGSRAMLLSYVLPQQWLTFTLGELPSWWDLINATVKAC